MCDRGAAIREERDRIVIMRSLPTRAAANPQSLREAERALERRRRNSAHFEAMLALLRQITRTGRMEEIRPLALRIAGLKGIAVDRAAKRQKESLVCWFCEQCPELLSGQKSAAAPRDPFAALGAEEVDLFPLTPEDGKFYSE